MALVLIEGWDNVATGDMTAKGWSTAANVMRTGRFGSGQAMAFVGSNSTPIRKSLPSTYSTLFFGFALNTTGYAGGSGNNLIVIQTAALGNILTVRFNASNQIQVYNAATTLVATGTTTLVTNTWNYIEVGVFVNTGTPASGTCEVHLNGVSEIASTAGNFGSTLAGSVGFFGLGATGNGCQYDDVYVADNSGSAPNNTFLGDVRIVTVYPNGAGAHSQWQPNGATPNYNCVDETTPDGDSTYVSDANPGDIDTYTFQDIDGGANVFGLQTNLYARKDDANTRQIAPVIRQGGSDSVGTTVTLSSSYQFYQQVYNADPASAAWTASNVNNDEFGVKEIA